MAQNGSKWSYKREQKITGKKRNGTSADSWVLPNNFVAVDVIFVRGNDFFAPFSSY